MERFNRPKRRHRENPKSSRSSPSTDYKSGFKLAVPILMSETEYKIRTSKIIESLETDIRFTGTQWDRTILQIFMNFTSPNIVSERRNPITDYDLFKKR